MLQVIIRKSLYIYFGATIALHVLRPKKIFASLIIMMMVRILMMMLHHNAL